MKILIVTHGRAGSTSLQYALSDVLNIEKIIEPFNTDLWENSFKSEPNYKGVEIPNNSIFKVIIGQDDDWILDKIYDFDKVIILMRDNLKDTIISSQNALKYGYLDNYSPTEKITSEQITYVTSNYNKLVNFNNVLDTINFKNKKIIWYNEIFSDYHSSFEVLRSFISLKVEQFDEMWNNYLNPKYRLNNG